MRPQDLRTKPIAGPSPRWDAELRGSPIEAAVLRGLSGTSPSVLGTITGTVLASSLGVRPALAAASRDTSAAAPSASPIFMEGRAAAAHGLASMSRIRMLTPRPAGWTVDGPRASPYALTSKDTPIRALECRNRYTAPSPAGAAHHPPPRRPGGARSLLVATRPKGARLALMSRGSSSAYAALSGTPPPASPLPGFDC